MTSNHRKIRVLIGKMGLDGHDRGAIVLSKMLREAGMEIIYTGLFQTQEMIVETAIQEDVDVVGLSFLSGEQLYYIPRVAKLLKEKGLNDILLIAGGTIPRRDIPDLKAAGISEVFLPGTPIETINNYIRQNVRKLEEIGNP